jgi:class 3 adenylate cyclase
MPMYMDIHNVDGATADALAAAHEADESVQHKHDVTCLKYWWNEGAGKLFCLFEAPSAEAANAVHREAHGLLAEQIIEVDPVLAEGFLGGGAVNNAGAVTVRGGDVYDTGVRGVLFTDIVGSTARNQEIGDDAALELVEAHDAIVRGCLATWGGREVKHTGDGIMASFISPASAVRCGREIQRALVARAEELPDDPLAVRIGAAAGEPVERNQDLFGSTVQLAARLCARAAPGEVLVSAVLADLCIGKGMRFDDLGEDELKGFPDPVRIRRVRLD